MQKSMFRKGIVCVILVLFIGASVVSGIYIKLEIEKDNTDNGTSSEDNYHNSYYLEGSKQSGNSEPWWDFNWNHRRKISIDHSFIDDSLTNFPILIVVDSIIGTKCDGGNSIRFISMDNSFEYYYEIEKWNGAGGNSYVWVNISDTIFSDSDFAFFMYYNNSDSSDNQNPGAVWDSNFKAIYHLTNWNDSTSNNYNLSENIAGYPDISTGKIGNCADFDGGDGHQLKRPIHDSGLTITGDLTLSTWVYLDGKSPTETIMPCFGTWPGGSSATNWLYYVVKAESYPTKLYWGHEYGNGQDEEGPTTNDYLQNYTWIYLTVTRDTTAKNYKFYLNGTFSESINYNYNPEGGDDSYLAIGGYPYGSSVIDGRLDEQRISNSGRNASWIKASYHTMNQTPGFLSISEEQSHPDIVYIDDDFDENTPGWGYDHFDKIQDGIDAVNESGTVYVYNGTYYENVEITKDSIKLIGEDKNTTIIDAINEIGNNAINIENHNYITISEFKIRNAQTSGPSYEGNGIRIYRSTTGNTISNCMINNNSQHGIFISAPAPGQNAINNSVINCEIYNSGYCGIRIGTDETTFVKNTSILNTKIYKNGISNLQPPIGYKSGISSNAKGEVRYTLISGCDFYDNFEYGIYFAEHSVYGANVNYNLIFHNNFLNDSNNAYDECTNFWNSSFGEGNYWCDYTGEDNDGDGIGDTPYPISGGSNQDNYPLMYPWGENPPIANFSYSVNESPVFFNGSLSYDRDGEIISYEWDFGDGTTGYGKIIYHKYCEIGTYDVTLTVTDDDGLKGNITKSVEVIKANIPPSLEIFGPNSGKPGTEYEYVFIVTDPDDDEFYLWVDWGDGDSTGWMGPFGSGEPVKLNHAWNETGTYVIKAKVKDFCGESEWAEFEVIIPRNRATFNSLFLWFLERFPIAGKTAGFYR